MEIKHKHKTPYSFTLKGGMSNSLQFLTLNTCVPLPEIAYPAIKFIP